MSSVTTSETILPYRVERLEADTHRIFDSVQRIETKLFEMDGRLLHLDGKLTHLPTMWQLGTLFVTQLVAIVGSLIAIPKFH